MIVSHVRYLGYFGGKLFYVANGDRCGPVTAVCACFLCRMLDYGGPVLVY